MRAVEVAPLARPEAEVLARECAPGELSPSALDSIVNLAAGYPLFLRGAARGPFPGSLPQRGPGSSCSGIGSNAFPGRACHCRGGRARSTTARGVARPPSQRGGRTSAGGPAGDLQPGLATARASTSSRMAHPRTRTRESLSVCRGSSSARAPTRLLRRLASGPMGTSVQGHCPRPRPPSAVRLALARTDVATARRLVIYAAMPATCYWARSSALTLTLATA